MNDMATYGITHYNAYFSPAGTNQNDGHGVDTATSPKSVEDAADCSTPNKEVSMIANRVSRSSSLFASESNLINDAKLSERSIRGAIESGSLEDVLRLIANGFDLNTRIGSTNALHLAVNYVGLKLGVSIVTVL